MKRTLRNPQQKIIQALTKLKQATWNDLKKETDLSKGALSKHLNLLIKYGKVKVDVDTSTSPKTIRYSLSPLSISELERKAYLDIDEKDEKARAVAKQERFTRDLIGFSVQSGYLISLVKDREKADPLLKDYIAFNLDSIALEIITDIEYCFHFSKGYMLAMKKENPQKQLDIFIKRFKTHYVKEFIMPWIESLAVSVFYNRDVIDHVWKNYRNEHIEKIDKSLFKSLYGVESSGS